MTPRGTTTLSPSRRTRPFVTVAGPVPVLCVNATRPDSSRASRPTVIVTNGSDGAISDLWSPTVAGALARGWNPFLYDGPGQQSMLFEHDTRFRPDWEAVLTPVLDALTDRGDIDGDRLIGYGVSQAGYWLPRALAVEPFRAASRPPGLADRPTAVPAPPAGDRLPLMPATSGNRRSADTRAATRSPHPRRSS